MNIRLPARLLLVAAFSLSGCRDKGTPPSTQPRSAYPIAIDAAEVGKYPALSKSGGGYFYDDVLEYRVWVHPKGGGDDSYSAFSTFEQALAFFNQTEGAELPLVLVRQSEWINEPKPGEFVHQKGQRSTEWQVEWLKDSKRRPDSIDRFIAKRRSGISSAATSKASIL